MSDDGLTVAALATHIAAADEHAARSFGASEWQIFRSVVIPSTVPFILTGLRLAIGRALIGVMVGELYAATAGIGFMITVAGAGWPKRVLDTRDINAVGRRP